MSFIVISFYTVNSPYEREVKGLIDSLNAFNLKYDIQGINSLGSWQKNTIYKAQFIKEMIIKHKGKNLVWIDADAVIKSDPFILSMIDSDVAFYYRTKGGREGRIQEPCELISACMFMKANDSVLRLLDMWIERNNNDHGDLEQHYLQQVIPEWRSQGGTHSVLPQQYCKIFDSQEDKIAVVQNQASRRFLAQMGGL